MKILFQELQQKSLLFGGIATAIVIYLVVIGVLGKYDNYMLAGDYLTSMGYDVNVMTFAMCILASLAFGGSTRKRLFQISQQNSTLKIFLVQVISVIIEYVCLVMISVGTVLLVQYVIFNGKVIGPHHINRMIVSLQANAYLVGSVIPMVMLVSMGVKHTINTVAAGIATYFLGQLFSAPFMFLVYTYRYMKWNPFNMLMIAYQITSPIYHTLTKLTNQESIAGIYIYSCICLCLILWILGRRIKIYKLHLSHANA